jgi:hypothetical protein
MFIWRWQVIGQLAGTGVGVEKVGAVLGVLRIELWS